MAGRDVLVVMPTGAGKSLCYQLPALEDSEALTLVVSPLVSLMQDQVEGLGDRAELINAQRTGAENAESLRRALAGEARMLYVAPERFWAPGIGEKLKGNVGLFVVDEAHCVSQWGHDFRPEYYKLGEIARRLEARSILAATATATPRVSVDIVDRLGLDDPVRIATGFERPNLSYDVVPISGDRARERAVSALLSEPGRAARDRLLGHAQAHRRDRGAAQPRARPPGARLPRRNGARAPRRGAARVHVGRGARGRGDERVRHGRRQGERAHRDPRGGALVARGLLPGGRPRRARRAARRAASSSHPGRTRASTSSSSTRPRIPDAKSQKWAQYRAVWGFVDGEGCRRVAILRHFGDRSAPVSEGRCCDACDGPLEGLAREEDRRAAQARARASEGGEDVRDAILRVVEEASPSVGRTRAVEILRGGRSKVVVKYAYDELPGYGEWNDWRAEELLGEVDAMLAAGIIHSTGGKFPKLEAA